jgi:hypothetical protein
MLISVPISYLVLAPPVHGIPGLHLGAAGLALRTLIINMIFVNINVWYLSRKYGWKLDFAYQPVMLGWSIIAGMAAHGIATRVPGMDAMPLSVQVAAGSVSYFFLQALLLRHRPTLFGLSSNSLVRILTWFHDITGSRKCA